MSSKRSAKRSRQSHDAQKNKRGRDDEVFRYNFDRENLNHWCFDACPKGELFMCWSYEHFRDCPSFIDRVLEWRKERKSYPDLPTECFASEPYERVITQWPEFPYLEIAPEIRRLYQRIRSIMGLSEIISFQSQEKEVAHFPIPDWSLSDNELKKKFEQWLKENRPRDCKIRETRGRSTTRFVKAALKALGAYRLSRVMSQNEVIGFALARGRRLYTNQPELSKVLKKTASYLAWLDQTEAS